MPVLFHSEDTDFSLPKKRLYTSWIGNIIKQHAKSAGNLNIIFCSNHVLLEINRKYLNHNYFTDVVTFEYDVTEGIDGDIFVSVDQVKLNADELKVDFIDELCRVIIHGVLHLLGYKDDTEEKVQNMRVLEDSALNFLKRLENGKKV